MALLDEATRTEVKALTAYAEDEAGGLMSPRFARVRPEMTVDEAIGYLKRQSRRQVEIIYYAYVLDGAQHLKGVVSFRDLFRARGDAHIRDLMTTDIVTISEETDQEEASRRLAKHDLLALPVLDSQGHMKGIVTFDDIADVVEEEATEDIQKLGGSEALDEPYLAIAFVRMLKKRAGWLAALFLGEMLTATAMTVYEKEIARAVVLALFVPLIISSGGNSGSQASTLVIRAMALGEVRLRDWFRVIRREAAAGLWLGALIPPTGVPTMSSLWHKPGESRAAVGRATAPGYVFALGIAVVGVVVVAGLAIGTGERAGVGVSPAAPVLSDAIVLGVVAVPISRAVGPLRRPVRAVRARARRRPPRPTGSSGLRRRSPSAPSVASGRGPIRGPG